MFCETGTRRSVAVTVGISLMSWFGLLVLRCSNAAGKVSSAEYGIIPSELLVVSSTVCLIIGTLYSHYPTLLVVPILGFSEFCLGFFDSIAEARLCTYAPGCSSWEKAGVAGLFFLGIGSLFVAIYGIWLLIILKRTMRPAAPAVPMATTTDAI